MNDYKDFDGWALGGTINFPQIYGAPDNGFCFTETEVCTLGYYGKLNGIYGSRIYT